MLATAELLWPRHYKGCHPKDSLERARRLMNSAEPSMPSMSFGFTCRLGFKSPFFNKSFIYSLRSLFRQDHFGHGQNGRRINIIETGSKVFYALRADNLACLPPRAEVGVTCNPVIATV